jgi:hypothetical protein
MKSYSDILAELQARKDRSAWDKGVTAYAVGLLDNYQDRAEYEGREAASCTGAGTPPHKTDCTRRPHERGQENNTKERIKK